MTKSVLYLVFVLFVANANSQTLSQNFNSGNRTLESNLCWQTPGCSFTNTAGEIIEGAYTLRTGQLTGGIANPNGLITPWSKLSGDGTITFQHKLTTWSNGAVRNLYVSLESADNPGVQDTVFRYSYTSANSSTTRTETINIPAYTAGKVYRIRVFAYGTGGTTRLLIDNVNYKGEYWSSPSTGCVPLPVIADADGDGVADDEDSFPNDKYRAHITTYPANEYGTLLFEDLWPAKGDYDFNDLVMNYRINTITNAENMVVETKYTFITKAIGGALRNGFAFQLDDLSPAKIISVTRTKNAGSLYSLAANGTEANQVFANIPVIANAETLLPSTGGLGTNVNPNMEKVKPDTTNVTVLFLQDGSPAPGQSAILLADVNSQLFNPYMVINQVRQIEVHEANKKPSSLANTQSFGTSDDNSNVAANRYYKTKNNLPWVLNIAADINYTQEGNDISTGYLKLIDWIISGGVNFTDWYMDKPGYRNNNNLYLK